MLELITINTRQMQSHLGRAGLAAEQEGQRATHAPKGPDFEMHRYGGRVELKCNIYRKLHRPPVMWMLYDGAQRKPVPHFQNPFPIHFPLLPFRELLFNRTFRA